MAALLPFLGLREIASRAEARIPLVAVDIVRTGRILPPYLLGEPYLNKPPLHHLLAAGAVAAFGRHDEWVVRLPSVLCGAISVWLTWLLGRRLGGWRAGLAAAAFLLLSYRFFSLSRSTELEILLTAATCAAYLGLANVFRGEAPSRQAWCLAAGGVAFASLTKGPVIALLFPFSIVAADAIVNRTARRVLSPGPLILILGALAGTAIFYGPLLVKLGGIEELRRRLTFENVLHDHGFHYYLWQLPLGLLPAGLALPWMLKSLRVPDPTRRVAAIALALGVLVFSLSPSKQSHYLLPLYPLAAIWAGASGVFTAWSGKRIGIGVVGCAALLLSADAVAQRLQRKDGSETPAAIMRDFASRSGATPLGMLERHPTLAYYLNRPDLEFPATPAAAVAFLDAGRGRLVVDLERGERLPAELEAGEKLDSRGAGSHTYLLISKPKSR